jgi:DNA gyrase/topoisomerase IV subunit A
MITAVNNLDVIFKLLKTKNVDKVKQLAKQLKITEEDSKTIWQIPVGRLDQLNLSSLTTEKINTVKRIKQVNSLYKIPTVSVLNNFIDYDKLNA